MSTDLILVARADEPCDCGSHVRHNNGGNYHSEYAIFFDRKLGKFTYLKATTCELVDYEDCAISDEELQQRLQEFQQYEKDNWYVKIDWELLNQLKNLDIEKVRKRVRDLLNKTTKKDDILTCACVLGAKLF